MKIYSFCICFLACTSLNAQNCCDMFSGIWQVKDKQQFEQWEQASEKLWLGKSYKIVNGEEAVSETLKIIKNGDTIIYEATVLNQNDGKAVPFVLNSNVKDKLSFENPNHDFPKKIQYQFLSERECHVQVIGDDGKEFSFTMLRN